MKHKKIVILILAALLIGIFLLFHKRDLFPLGSQLIAIPSINDVADVGTFGKSISISPDGKWLVYIGNSDKILFDGMPDYNIISYNLVSNQKYIIDKKDRYGTQLAFGLNRNCWTNNSRYCYIGNDTGVAIDFSGITPVLIDKNYSNEVLTCSDCSFSKEEKRFSKRQHGYTSLSPDGKNEIVSVSYGNSFVSQPYIYLLKNGLRRFITREAYTINWSADSKSVYLVKRDSSLYRLDLYQ